MTRSSRTSLPAPPLPSLDNLHLHANPRPDRPGVKKNNPRDPIDEPQELNDSSSKRCRGYSNKAINRGERGAVEQYLGLSVDDSKHAMDSEMLIALRKSAAMGAIVYDDQSTAPEARRKEKVLPVDVESYTQPFLSFISENPTTFHAVETLRKRLESHGFTTLSERDSWKGKLSRGGKYCFTRNGSSVIAFVVGDNYKPGNGASVIASHIDALTTRVKPIPTLSTKAGYLQLGVAPYAGALNNTWWDRDLGVGGRVLVKDSKTGKIETKLVKLSWPIARIPTLAPHFGAASDLSHPNKETEMVPIIGLDNADSDDQSSNKQRNLNSLGGAGTFTATQPERLVKAIAGEMNIQDCKHCTFDTNSIAKNS